MFAEHIKAISVKSLIKSFDKETIINGIDFDINKGEFVSLYGANGCGKSTLLNIIGGIDTDYNGDVKCFDEPAKPSLVARVFQDSSDSLFPWLTIRQNIELPFTLTNQRHKKIASDDFMHAAAKDLEILSYLDHYPYEVSGGIRQRCCIARALAEKKEVLLLDEPFSALDYDMTWDLVDILLNCSRKYKTTIVLVSHNPDHAIYLSDRILILSSKPIQQIHHLCIDFSEPRNKKLLLDPKFDVYRHQLFTHIRGIANEI
jgi:NitT/TauT family transport system ATP-binding protein